MRQPKTTTQGDPIWLTGTGKAIKKRINTFLDFLDDKIKYQIIITPIIEYQKDKVTVAKTYKQAWVTLGRKPSMPKVKLPKYIPVIGGITSLKEGNPITLKQSYTPARAKKFRNGLGK